MHTSCPSWSSLRVHIVLVLKSPSVIGTVGSSPGLKQMFIGGVPRQRALAGTSGGIGASGDASVSTPESPVQAAPAIEHLPSALHASSDGQSLSPSIGSHVRPHDTSPFGR